MKEMVMQHVTITFYLLTYMVMVNVNANIDLKRYNEGKDQYELMDQQSQMPKYGQCWRDSMVLLKQGCGKLTDEIQTRLSLAYLSCFLQVKNQDQTYEFIARIFQLDLHFVLKASFACSVHSLFLFIKVNLKKKKKKLCIIFQ